MAHRRSSIKKIRIDRKRRERNVSILSGLRTQMRKTTLAITSKKVDDASKEVRELFSQLDKAVKKNLMHKKSASRQKSRFTLRVNKLKASK